MGPKIVKHASVPVVVLDTNVFISAVLFRGQTSRLVDLWKNDRVIILLSAEVLKEYARVLAYPKFKLTRDEIKSVLEEELLPYVATVRIYKVPRVIPEDPSDDKFLALAKAGKAAYLISGDEHLLRLKTYSKTKIVPPVQFLAHF